MTYKFRFEEFEKPKELFARILEEEENWEQAKLHLDKGYLIEWLKKKGEIDALISIEQYSSETKDLNFLLSIICYSIIEREFEIFGQKISTMSDISDLVINRENEIKEIILKDNLCLRYKGYINSKNIQKDDLLHWLEFIKDLKYKSLEEKWGNIKKVTDWAANSKKYLYLESISQEDINFLMTEKEYHEIIHNYLFPSSMALKPIFLPNEKLTKETIKFLNKFQTILLKLNIDIKDSKNIKKQLIEYYFPKKELLSLSTTLDPGSFLSLFNHLIEKEKIEKINYNSILPHGLYDDLTKNDDIILFSYAMHTMFYFDYFNRIHSSEKSIVEPKKYFEKANPKLTKQLENSLEQKKKLVSHEYESHWINSLSIIKFIKFGIKANSENDNPIFISKEFFNSKLNEISWRIPSNVREDIKSHPIQFFDIFEKSEEEKRRRTSSYK